MNTPRISMEAVGNVGWYRFNELMQLLDADGLLKPEKRKIVLERNPIHLEDITSQLLRDFLPQNLKYATHTLQSHYKVSDGQVNHCSNLDDNSDILKLIYRTKHPCSFYEKITRENKFKLMRGSNIFGEQHRIDSNDSYGITIVTRKDPTGEKVHRLVCRLLNTPYLKIKDIDSHDKKKGKYGYDSTHLIAEYLSTNQALNGAHLEIQIHDVDAEKAHQEDPQQSHQAYGKIKMQKQHIVPADTQIIVYGGGVVIPPGIGPVRELERCFHVEVPTYLRTKYDLIMPKKQ